MLTEKVVNSAYAELNCIRKKPFNSAYLKYAELNGRFFEQE